MKELTRRQHFVPRTYLKNFGYSKKKDIYSNVLPKDSDDENSIFESNIINICLEKDLYTLPGKTADEKMLLETFYNENYETHYQRIYEILTDPEKEILTEKEHKLVISTVVTMLYRTKKWITDFNHFFDRVLEAAYIKCEQSQKDYFTFEETKISVKGKSLEELQNGFRNDNKQLQILTMLETALKLIDLRLVNDGIMVSKLEDNSAGFISSDNPVSISNNYSVHLAPFNPTNVLKIPLDSNHLLHLMPYANESNKKIIIRNNMTDVLSYTQNLTSNYEQFQNAERFLVGNENSLKSFLKQKKMM
ncbi:DUF4238 domain-containing protein [Chryseobacterium sp. cx-311]|uniref:DUF4238 domain-containing protein n=1 Tax=Marnyiella aurantia TaxID=2758037 RepID=UPI001AE523AD|nr:DUF4238 domain-containing protein [Marnyiella aurantia]MBP0612203.1 DUF4238 domain-containing protein [Marnyiella aurantia]